VIEEEQAGATHIRVGMNDGGGSNGGHRHPLAHSRLSLFRGNAPLMNETNRVVDA